MPCISCEWYLEVAYVPMQFSIDLEDETSYKLANGGKISAHIQKFNELSCHNFWLTGYFLPFYPACPWLAIFWHFQNSNLEQHIISFWNSWPLFSLLIDTLLLKNDTNLSVLWVDFIYILCIQPLKRYAAHLHIYSLFV